MRQLTLSLHVLLLVALLMMLSSAQCRRKSEVLSLNTSVKPTRGPLTNASDTGSSMFRLFAFVVPRINTSAKPSIKRAC